MKTNMTTGSHSQSHERYTCFGDDDQEIGEFCIYPYSKVFSEIAKFKVYDKQRHKGHGRSMLGIAFSLTKTPLAIATVRHDNVHWVDVNVDAGFRMVHTIYKPTGDLYVFMKSHQFEYPRVEEVL